MVELSNWLLQYFFMSLFDMPGWLDASVAMQSFICCLCDLLWLLLPLLADDELDDGGVVVALLFE